MTNFELTQDQAKIAFGMLIEEQAFLGNELQRIIKEKVKSQGREGESLVEFTSGALLKSLRITSTLVDFYRKVGRDKAFIQNAVCYLRDSNVMKASGLARLYCVWMEEAKLEVTFEEAVDFVAGGPRGTSFGQQTDILERVDATNWDNFVGLLKMVQAQVYFIGKLGQAFNTMDEKLSKGGNASNEEKAYIDAVKACIVSRNPRLVTLLFKSPQPLFVSEMQKEFTEYGISEELAAKTAADISKVLDSVK